jgi:RNA polymerase sigma factor (sigma-70 family)
MSPAGFPRLPGAQSDQRLLALARDGDERAFEAFVRRYRRALLRYSRRMGLSDSLAEDVVQQSLLRAWLALERGGEVHAPKAWLYRTVHNTAVNALRSARNHTPLEDGVPVEPAPSAESDFERRIAVRQTLGDVACLPRMQREAILLTAFDGSSHEDIALALGVTHGAVRGLLYRARTTLRDAAAAVLPQPVVLWASGLLARLTPGAAKAAELSASAGSGDMGGAFAKGAALAVSAAVLAVGTGVVPLPRHVAHRSEAAAQALGIGQATADAQTSRSPLTPTATAREGGESATGGSGRGRRSGTSRRTATTPVERVGPAGDGRSRHSSSETSGSNPSDIASQRGGEEELAQGRGRTLQPADGSAGLQTAEHSPSDSARGGPSAPECDHCSGESGGGDEGPHRSDTEPAGAVVSDGAAPTSTSASATAITSQGSGEALAERQGRD